MRGARAAGSGIASGEDEWEVTQKPLLVRNKQGAGYRGAVVRHRSVF